MIKILSDEEESFSPFGHILASAKHLTDTGRISCSHVRRISNSVAHNLTKHARHVSGYKVWIEDVPPHLFSVLLADSG